MANDVYLAGDSLFIGTTSASRYFVPSTHGDLNFIFEVEQVLIRIVVQEPAVFHFDVVVH